MKKMDEELIEHITSQLHKYELPYDAGAWERFSEQDHKRRGIFFWPLWVAAALILVCGGIFFTLNTSRPTADFAHVKPKKAQDQSVIAEITVQKEVKQHTATGTGLSSATQDPKPAAQNDQPFAVPDFVPFINNPVATTQSNRMPELNDVHVQLKNQLYSNRLITDELPVFEVNLTQKPAAVAKKMSFEEILAKDSRNLAQNTSKKVTPSKWQPGVYVAPSVGNDSKVQMNYGFSLSYALADKLSINSGIAYNTMSTTSNLTNGNANSSDAVASSSLTSKGAVSVPSTSKSLESIDASLRGVNIPLELKYTISSKFYTGVGVSALAVLNNKKDANYLVSTAQNATVANAAGFADQKILLVTEKVSEPQPASAVSADKLIGFYNFSVGYKQKISKSKNFAVEPFLRVPMKTFSSDNLNLTNGGLRLKLDF